MFLGVPMTGAAVERLEAFGVPQSLAVCIPPEVWDEYILGETPIHRELLAKQLIADLRACLSDDGALPEVTSIETRFGLVKELRNGSRVIKDCDHLIAWINKHYRKEVPPRVAISIDGTRIRFLTTGANANAVELGSVPFGFFHSGAGCAGELYARMKHRAGECASDITLASIPSRWYSDADMPTMNWEQ